MCLHCVARSAAESEAVEMGGIEPPCKKELPLLCTNVFRLFFV